MRLHDGLIPTRAPDMNRTDRSTERRHPSANRESITRRNHSISSTVTSVFVVVFAVALAVGGAGRAAADSSSGSHGDELERWVFSSAVEIGVFGHTGKGNVDATETGTPRIANPNFQFGDSRSQFVVPEEGSREDVLSMLVGGTFEVMTPSLFDVRTQPRLFLDVNVSAVITNDVGLARDGDPGPLGFPNRFQPTGILGEDNVAGRGTKITVQHQGPQVHAGLGTALTFDFGPERIRIKPSVVYSRITTDIFAVGKRAVRLTGIQNPRDFSSEFRTINLSEKVREVYHGVGPALEIEYETANRLGPFAISLYLKGHASHLLGDLKTRMQKTNPDPQVVGTETIRWKYSQDRWVFRAGTGMRFRLVPKRER